MSRDIAVMALAVVALAVAACSEPLPHAACAAPCSSSGSLPAPSVGRLAAETAPVGCTLEGPENTRGSRAEACRILGEAARGKHDVQDDEIADGAFGDACALGLEDACGKVRKLELALSPDGKWLAGIGSSRLNPTVWSLSSGERVYAYLQDIRFDQMVFSPDSSRLRLVGALNWKATPPHDPSVEVHVEGWEARSPSLLLPLVYGWLEDRRLVWRDPDGTALKTSTETGRRQTVRNEPTSAVACDHRRCVAPIEHHGTEGSLVLDSGGQAREAPRLNHWIVGSRLARIDCQEAFDLRAWRRVSISGPLREECASFGQLFVSDAGAWTTRGDELIAFDPATFALADQGVTVPGLSKCAPAQTNPVGCVWDAERGRLVIQNGGNIRVVDMRSGRTTIEFAMR